MEANCCKLPSTLAPVFIVQSVFFTLFPMIIVISDDHISLTIGDRYFASDNDFIISEIGYLVILAPIIISLFRGSAIVISAIKFDHLRACLLCYSPANLLPGLLCVQTYELTRYMLAYLFDSFVWTRI